MSSIGGVINGAFLSRLVSPSLKGGNTSTSSSTDLPSSITDIRSGLKSAGYRYADAFQKVNAVSSVIFKTEDTLEKLGKIVDKVITIAEAAYRGGSDDRLKANGEFRKLARDYKKLVNKAELDDGTSLLEKDGIQKLLTSLGLDPTQADSLSSVFARFVTPGKTEKLSDDGLRGARPIRAALTTFGDGTLASAVSFSAGTEVMDGGVAIADFDNDGNLDAVLSSNFSGNELNVILGSGDGTFQSPTVFTPGNSPYAASAGDVDEDGNEDVTYADNVGNINLLLGDGTGNLSYDSQYTLDASVTSTAANRLLDINGDDNLDIIALSTAGTLHTFLGNGAGSFGTANTLAVGTDPTAGLTSAYFDGDAFLDLAATNAATGEVQILIGNGDGTFNLGGTYSTANPTHILSGDFDGDGNADILTGGTAASPRLALGNGDGTFDPEVDANLGFFPNNILAADFNDDGNLDVFGSKITGEAAIALGNGDGTFAAATSITTSYAFQWPVAADFDGDGVQEIVTGSNNSTSLFYLSQNETTTSKSRPVELDSIFSAARTLSTKGDAKLVLTDAKELKKQIKENLKALRDVREYLGENLTLIRSTALGLIDISDNLTTKVSAEDLASRLRESLLSSPLAARRTSDTLDSIFATSLLTTADD